MPYIYRYSNNDGEFKYVGIIREDSNFSERFYQHERDEWYRKEDKWKIEYSYYGSQTDVEMLEAHLISSYTLNGCRLFNKAKQGWGISSFLKEDEIEWKEWERPRFKYGSKEWRKEKNKLGFMDYVRIGAKYQLLKLVASDFYKEINYAPRFQSAKINNRLGKMHKSVFNLEGDLGLEDAMLFDLDPKGYDYPVNHLLSIFYHAFDRDNPVANLVSDKTTELLYEYLFKTNSYQTRRELDGEDADE